MDISNTGNNSIHAKNCFFLMKIGIFFGLIFIVNETEISIFLKMKPLELKSMVFDGSCDAQSDFDAWRSQEIRFRDQKLKIWKFHEN